MARVPSRPPSPCRRWLVRLGVGVATSLLAACTYPAAVTLTNVPKDRSHPVRAEMEKFIVLGFTFDNDRVIKLPGELRDQCPGGQVRGILTKDLRTFYFLTFFWSQDVIAEGYCIKSAHADDGGSLNTAAAGSNEDRDLDTLNDDLIAGARGAP